MQGNWNGQGNGNWNQQQQQGGYGQNQGYGGGADSQYATLTAQTVNNQSRDPYIGEGQHVLAVISIEEFFSQNAGPCVRASFEVLESKFHPVGSTVGAMWAMLKPAPKPGMTRDQDRFVDFMTRLKGAPVGYPIGQDIHTLLKVRPQDQLARGTVIRALGVKKVGKESKKEYVLVSWDHVEQTPQQIAQLRQKIDARVASSGGQPQQGGGQFQSAPHPSQMPNQYPAQSQAWGQPQQPAPQPQPGPSPQPQGQPQGWGAPQGTPQGGGWGNGSGGQGSW